MPNKMFPKDIRKIHNDEQINDFINTTLDQNLAKFNFIQLHISQIILQIDRQPREN